MYRSNKVLTPQEIIEKFTKDKNLVFVSGVFDILHFGHITFLRKAKEIVGESGKLLITLHSDGIVKKIKGEERPYMNIKERVELLSELECVDYVTEWEGWENITEFVEQLKPKYLAITDKSYDHTKKGEWTTHSWDEMAKKINASIIKIPIEKDFASSKYGHLFG